MVYEKHRQVTIQKLSFLSETLPSFVRTFAPFFFQRGPFLLSALLCIKKATKTELQRKIQQPYTLFLSAFL